MAGTLIASSCAVGALAPTVPDGPLQQLLEAIWNREPAPVALVQGRWRWRGATDQRNEVRELLARKLGPGTVPFDPQRSHRLTLPPTTEASRPCEVALYPALIFDLTNDDLGATRRTPVYLCLFYSMQSSTCDPSPSERERAYFRVVEELDRFHEEVRRQNPDRPVRAIDLPMPGWMGAQLGPPRGNACPLVYG